MPVFMRFQLSWLDSRICQIFPAIMEILTHYISSAFMDIMILCIYSSWRFWSRYIVRGNYHTCHILYHAYSWPLYSCVFGTTVCTCCHVQSLVIILYYWMASSSTSFFITPLLGWNCNVFQPSYHRSNLTHYRASVTVDFNTHGGSHIYGLPYPFVNSLDPMDHFCRSDVSKIIPKNMHYFPYTTFKPILTYICRYDP